MCSVLSFSPFFQWLCSAEIKDMITDKFKVCSETGGMRMVEQYVKIRQL